MTPEEQWRSQTVFEHRSIEAGSTLSSRELPGFTTVRLHGEMFRPDSRELLTYGSFRVNAFRFDRGIEGLDIANDAGNVLVLPFVGQKIWDANFHGRNLKMRSALGDPVPTSDYLSNNGAYLIHCGGAAMGNPGPGDSHPLHGELPNARLDEAALVLGPARGAGPATLTVMGRLRHRIAFGPQFDVKLTLTITEGSGLLDSTVCLTNRSGDIRPLMYLAHINFRPAIGGRIVETLDRCAEINSRGDVMIGDAATLRSVTLRELVTMSSDYAELLRSGCRVLPELVQTVPLRADAQGWVRCTQEHPGGAVDIVEHDRRSLTHTLRWLRRSADEDAFGFALPATAEADGFTAESAKGHVAQYASGKSLIARFRHGALAAGEEPPPRSALLCPLVT